MDLIEEPARVALRLASGVTLDVDRVVLATGHDPKPAIAGIPAEQPWTPGSLDGLDVDAPLMIVGAGLTMVDMALSLDRRGHRGPIVVVSRRGLISHAHRPAAPGNIEAEKIPFGADASKLLRWIRAFAAARRRLARGGRCAEAAHAAPLAVDDEGTEAALPSPRPCFLGHSSPSHGAGNRGGGRRASRFRPALAHRRDGPCRRDERKRR